MRLQELITKLQEIKDRGFIPSLRGGTTGVGYTFETIMNLSETNIPMPDIGGRVEIKSTRKDANSLVTLFTFNRGVWLISQRDIIERFGYIDEQGRKALKSTVFYNRSNSLNMSIDINIENNTVNLFNREVQLASWDLYEVVGKFYSKFSRLLLVFAERRILEGQEEFCYNEAYLLTNPQTRNFIDAFMGGIIGIDIRMHLKENNAVRNRGTGFRISEPNLLNLFSDRTKLI